MFNQDSLLNIKTNEFSLSCYRGLYCTVYRQYAFNTPSSEETIRISRSPRLGRDSGVMFWLAAILQDDWSDRMEYFQPYLTNARYLPITETKFNSLVAEYCGELITKPTHPLNTGDFKGALLMYDVEDDLMVDLYAEYDNEYIHFYWESTA